MKKGLQKMPMRKPLGGFIASGGFFVFFQDTFLNHLKHKKEKGDERGLQYRSWKIYRDSMMSR